MIPISRCSYHASSDPYSAHHCRRPLSDVASHATNAVQHHLSNTPAHAQNHAVIKAIANSTGVRRRKQRRGDLTLTRSLRWQRTWRPRRGSATRQWDRLRPTATDPEAEMEEAAAVAGPRRRQQRRDAAIGGGGSGKVNGWGSGFVPRRSVCRRRRGGRGVGREAHGGASCAATGAPARSRRR